MYLFIVYYTLMDVAKFEIIIVIADYLLSHSRDGRPSR